MICKSCKQEIVPREVSPGVVRWGHTVNPTFQHHYANPRRVAPPTEAEKRALWRAR